MRRFLIADTALTNPGTHGSPRRLPAWRPHRSAGDRVVAGVAAGLAHDLKLDPILIRVAFVVLSLAQGAGGLLYLMLLAASAEERTSVPSEGRSGTRQVLGVACVVTGLLLALRYLGFWFGDAIVWPLATIALGSTFVWLRADGADRTRWNAVASQVVQPPSLFGTKNIIRLALGVALVAVGTAAVLREYSPVSLGKAVIPVSLTILGLLLALGPWLLRLSRQLGEERRDRIRSEERAAMAAHLHDSVLQTLALIQRSSSAQEVATLARQQERELRAWLYGRATTPEEASSIRVAIDAMAARMEKAHRIPIEAVIVGDWPMTEAAQALVQAAGEAMNNAGRHSGATNISVYAEVEPDSIVVYVRDEGKGFDPSTVPEDRRGIADSIKGRIARFGGTADITTEVGAGTEVRIRVPRAAS